MAWLALRSFTDARIGLFRGDNSLVIRKVCSATCTLDQVINGHLHSVCSPVRLYGYFVSSQQSQSEGIKDRKCEVRAVGSDPRRLFVLVEDFKRTCTGA